MKKTLYLLFAILLMVSTFMISPVKAQDQPCSGSDPLTGSCPVPGNGTNLPINNGIFYLLIAGVIVGIAAVKKHETTLHKAIN